MHDTDWLQACSWHHSSCMHAITQCAVAQPAAGISQQTCTAHIQLLIPTLPWHILAPPCCNEAALLSDARAAQEISTYNYDSGLKYAQPIYRTGLQVSIMNSMCNGCNAITAV
jgi:hypothetical protein